MLGIIIDATKSPEQKAEEIAKAAERKAVAQAKRADALAALPPVTAMQLARDYEANTIAADQKYKDKEFKVTGKVTDINTDFMGNPYITMGGTNEFMQPQFQFDSDSAEQLAKISKGMRLTLICTGQGDIAKTPTSGNCQIIE